MRYFITLLSLTVLMFMAPIQSGAFAKCGCKAVPACPTACPTPCPIVTPSACPTGAAASIPAVPLDKYLKNNGFKAGDIEQIMPLPPCQSVQTGGAASIPAVTLKDYVKDNGYNPNKIKQYVPVPALPQCPATPSVTPTCPIFVQPVVTPAPVVVPQAKPVTGGAAPVKKPVRGLW